MAKAKWTFDKIPDQTTKVAIVTGSNSGTGFETAKALARKGAQIIMACRNLEKAEKAKTEILDEYPNVSLDIIQLDLSDLASVRLFTEKFNKKYKKLDLLINNAGVMMLPNRESSKDGFEMQLATNHFGHFALTGLLIEKLLSTENSRIVNMSSTMHLVGKMDFDDINWEKSYSKVRAYGRSKLANLLFTYELNRRLKTSGSTTISTAAHPGWTATNLQRHTGGLRFMNTFIAMNPPKGSLSILRAATDPEVEGGDFYGPTKLVGLRGFPEKVRSSKRSYNLEDAKKFWEISEELTGIKFSL